MVFVPGVYAHAQMSLAEGWPLEVTCQLLRTSSMAVSCKHLWKSIYFTLGYKKWQTERNDAKSGMQNGAAKSGMRKKETTN